MSVQRGIVIGGGAFAGLALALALRQGLGPDFAITVADPALDIRPSRDPRATAIVAACRRLFEAIGVWSDVAGRRAADSGHGRHRFETARRDATGIPDIFRSCRTRRALRAHGREPLFDRRAGSARDRRGDRSSRIGGFRFCHPQRRERCHAFGRQRDRSKSSGGRRRRAIEIARARRHSDAWVGLRSIRNRGHGRPRPRSPGPRRRAFPSRRALCDPAVVRKALIAGLDGKARRGGADFQRLAKRSFTANSNGDLACTSAR